MSQSFLDATSPAGRRPSPLSGGNLAYIDALYERYLEDAAAVPAEWRDYFDLLPPDGDRRETDVPHGPIRAHFEALGRRRTRRAGPGLVVSADHERKQMRLAELIAAYRSRGHKRSRIDPLGMMERRPAPELALAHHHLSEADRDTRFQTGTLHIGAEEATLGEILAALEGTYCGSIGAEYMHIVDADEQRWVQQRLESARGQPSLSAAVRREALERLTAAEGLERYLHARYPGTKRFGLEGGESLIPLLHTLLQRAGELGVVECVLGMAHRGRLNVLVNVLGKHPHDLFDEFEGNSSPESGSGDVKYHQGFSSDIRTPGGEMHLALGFNPSHLEIVGPVIEGSVRARQDRRGDVERLRIVPVVIHGDAAFAGQGVVMETFQMSQTRAFHTGGTVHVIIDNQVGFTTHRQDDARSTEYCTEIARMVQAPIFHVNGDDPDAVLFVTRLAVDYRMHFRKDVVIDLVCYRKRGHNEAEEPAKTQPMMYQRIAQMPSTRASYAERLLREGIIGTADAERLVADYRAALDAGRHVALGLVAAPDTSQFVDWRPFLGHAWDMPCDTRLPLARLQSLGNSLLEVPAGFALHAQVRRVLDDRRMMAAGAMPVNWGFAEMLAYATLVDDGCRVRLVGQDSGIGTFSHRHAVLHSQRDGRDHVPLSLLGANAGAAGAGRAGGPGVFQVFDSLLSEEAVLAFEYGYATTAPNALVIWEAQFGDFANGAQVVIDQFITSGEHKWGRVCGLVMLLPHGYEGQGPEHSSARLERYLQLCAEHNIQVCIPSTPAQVYHLLRRQMLRPLRKPLVVLTPKSLLRHKLAVSTLDELANGSFRMTLPEVDGLAPEAVRRVVLCSGKVYFDLLERRRRDARQDIAIVRIEQLYPFPETELAQVLAPYQQLEAVVWCQEEPMNQGAWYSSQHRMRRVALAHEKHLYLRHAGREPSAAPAVGYLARHLAEQERLVHDALYGDG